MFLWYIVIISKSEFFLHDAVNIHYQVDCVQRETDSVMDYINGFGDTAKVKVYLKI